MSVIISPYENLFSNTAKYGDVTSGPKVIDARVKKTMGKLLKRIQNGKFAKEWIAENEAGRPNFNALIQQDKDHLIEKVGAELRGLMSWLKK